MGQLRKLVFPPKLDCHSFVIFVKIPFVNFEIIFEVGEDPCPAQETPDLVDPSPLPILVLDVTENGLDNFLSLEVPDLVLDQPIFSFLQQIFLKSYPPFRDLSHAF